MKNLLKSLLFAIYLINGGAIAEEHKPFGMMMGMSKQEMITALKGAKIHAIGKSAFLSEAAIEKSPYFTRYLYTLTPETGLCGVTGLSDDFTDAYSAMAQYTSIKTALISKYGQPSKSFEKGVNTFLPIVSALQQGVTKVDDYWGLEEGGNGDRIFTLESETLLYIQLGLIATAPNAIAIGLQYPFKNYEQCREITIKDQAKAL